MMPFTVTEIHHHFSQTTKKGLIVLQSEQGITQKIEVQQKLYLAYAHAAERYVRKPTIYNWERKEKAFETYNATIIRFKKNAD